MLTDDVQHKSSRFSTQLPNRSFSQLVQTHLCHAMHTSFRSIAMLVLITSAFAPVFSAPFECVLIYLFYYCNMADLFVVLPRVLLKTIVLVWVLQLLTLIRTTNQLGHMERRTSSNEATCEGGSYPQFVCVKMVPVAGSRTTRGKAICENQADCEQIKTLILMRKESMRCVAQNGWLMIATISHFHPQRQPSGPLLDYFRPCRLFG